jgi:FHS family Na+ dependent glucose MFS transporter 1
MNAPAARDALPATQAVRVRSFLGYCLAFLALGLANASLGPALPTLARNTGSSLAQISALFVFHRLGYLCGALWGGRLFDRAAGNRVMGAALLVTAAGVGILPFPALRGLLFLAIFAVGLSGSVLDVGGNVLLVWWFHRRVGPYMNALHFFFGLGAFLAPLLITWSVLVKGGLTWSYWLLGLFILPTAAWLLRQPSPPRPAAPPGAAARGARLLPLLFLLFFLLFVAAEMSYGDWLYSYALARKLAAERVAGLLTSTYWGAFTAGRLLTVPLAARLRPGTLLRASLAGCALSLAALLVWPGSLTAAWAGSLGFGLSMASVFPTTMTLAGERLRLSGRATGLFLVGGSAGGMALPWLIGQLFAPVGPAVVILAILAAVLLGLGVLEAIMRSAAAGGTP